MAGRGLLFGAGDLGNLDFGGEYPALPDVEELAEEDDELNEETFGIDIPSDEWDIQDLSVQTAQLRSGQQQTHASEVGYQQDMWGHHQAWLEESISHLIDEDDDDVLPKSSVGCQSNAVPIPEIFKSKPPTGKDLNSLFGVGSPQTPFLDMVIASRAGTIWGPQIASEPVTVIGGQKEAESVNGREENDENKIKNTVEKHQDLTANLSGIEFGSFGDLSSSDQQEDRQEPLRALLSQMQVQEEKVKTVARSPLKGAKTLDEIEAEIRTAAAISPKESRIGKSKVMSLEELEREILGESSPNTSSSQTNSNSNNTSAQLAMQQHLLKLHQAAAGGQTQIPARISPNNFMATPEGGVPRGPSPTPAPLQGLACPPPLDPRLLPRFPPGHPLAGMPLLPPPPGLVQAAPQQQPTTQGQPPAQPPPLPPAVLMNPQFRAALATHLAAGKTLPPSWNLNPAMLAMLFRSPMMAQRMPPPGMVLPPLVGGMSPQGSSAQEQQVRQRFVRPAGVIRFQQQGGGKILNRRPLDSGNGQLQARREPRDPFSGLMGKREREWLIKIHTMQTQTDNPYLDDYYYTMLKNKQLAKGKNDGSEEVEKEPVTQKDSGENGNAHPYVYVPPKFEGSLGKVQYLSANFPRQLIDLAKDSSEEECSGCSGDSQEKSAAESSARNHSVGLLQEIKKPPGMSNMRQFKVLLMEVENLWRLILDCEDHQRQLLAAPEEAKTGIQFAVKVRVGQLTERIGGERLPLISCIRKGKHLIARCLGLLDKEQSAAFLQDLCSYMSHFIRKDMNEEALEIMFPAILECAKRLNKSQLLSVIEKLPSTAVRKIFSAKNKFLFTFSLLLMCQCSHNKVLLPTDKEAVKAVVLDWSKLVADCNKEDFPLPDWLSRNHVTCLCRWLAQEVNAGGGLVEKLKERLGVTCIVTEY